MDVKYHCCAKPSIQTFDYKQAGDIVENRTCLSCGIHWHKGRVYDKKRWQEMMDSKHEYDREFFELKPL